MYRIHPSACGMVRLAPIYYTKLNTFFLFPFFVRISRRFVIPSRIGRCIRFVLCDLLATENVQRRCKATSKSHSALCVCMRVPALATQKSIARIGSTKKNRVNCLDKEIRKKNEIEVE